MNLMVIEPAILDDLAEILQLQKRAFRTEAELHGNYDIEPLKQTFASIRSDFSTHSFLKAVHENVIIGSIRYRVQQECVWVGKLIVDPLFRRQGVGRQLLAEVERANSGAVRFRLFTAASSLQNIRLYESAGYRVCGEYRDEQQAGLLLVNMEKHTH